jgi:hypothetical protein
MKGTCKAPLKYIRSTLGPKGQNIGLDRAIFQDKGFKCFQIIQKSGITPKFYSF